MTNQAGVLMRIRKTKVVWKGNHFEDADTVGLKIKRVEGKCCGSYQIFTKVIRKENNRLTVAVKGEKTRNHRKAELC